MVWELGKACENVWGSLSVLHVGAMALRRGDIAGAFLMSYPWEPHIIDIEVTKQLMCDPHGCLLTHYGIEGGG